MSWIPSADVAVKMLSNLDLPTKMYGIENNLGWGLLDEDFEIDWEYVPLEKGVKGYHRSDNQACYANLLDMVCQFPSTDRIYTELKGSVLPIHTQERYLEICDNVGFVPKHLGPWNIHRGAFIVYFRDMTASEAYIKLSMLRNLHEDPRLVEVFVKMNDMFGFDPRITYALAMMETRSFCGHNFLVYDYTITQPTQTDPNKSYIPINRIVGLSRILRDPKAHDNHVLDNTEETLRRGFDGFKAIKSITKAAINLTKPSDTCSLLDLFDEKFQAVLLYGEDEEIKETLEERK